MATAAGLLTELIRKHCWTLYGFANPQESAALNLLFKDLDQPKAAEAIQRIGAESWYADLKEAPTAYESLYQNIDRRAFPVTADRDYKFLLSDTELFAIFH